MPPSIQEEQDAFFRTLDNLILTAAELYKSSKVSSDKLIHKSNAYDLTKHKVIWRDLFTTLNNDLDQLRERAIPLNERNFPKSLYDYIDNNQTSTLQLQADYDKAVEVNKIMAAKLNNMQDISDYLLESLADIEPELYDAFKNDVERRDIREGLYEFANKELQD